MITSALTCTPGTGLRTTCDPDLSRIKTDVHVLGKPTEPSLPVIQPISMMKRAFMSGSTPRVKRDVTAMFPVCVSGSLCHQYLRPDWTKRRSGICDR